MENQPIEAAGYPDGAQKDLPTRMALVVGGDSYLPHAKLISEALTGTGFIVELVLCETDGNAAVSQRQITRFGADKIPLACQSVREDELGAPSFLDRYDVIYFGACGKSSRQFLEKVRTYRKQRQRRLPVTICAFPGVLYYIQTYGQWCRQAADILLFNERRTLRDYRSACRYLFHISSENAVLFGYPMSKETDSAPGQRNDLVYVDQNILPRKKKDRIQLYKKLLVFASQTNFTKLVILARSLPEENSNHQVARSLHVQTLVDEILETYDPRIPVVIEYGPPHRALRSCALCLGVTSTVLIEAINAGIPTVPIIAKGVSGRFGGWRLFQKSPMAMTLDDLISGRPVQQPSQRWVDENLHVPGPQDKEKLVHKIRSLLRDSCARRDSARPLLSLHCSSGATGRIQLVWLNTLICRVFDTIVHSKIRY